MKLKITLAEIVFMLLISMSLFSQNYSYLSDYDGQGVPLDMVNTSVSVSLVDNINASLPENYPVPEYNPEYISEGVETNIILTELADVWVTFVGEGAGYKNVLGFYTYDVLNPPLTPPSDEDITIIFPNVSAAGSGGGLIVGDKMYLGQYPANTGIGWVLIANGWNGSNVTYGNWVLYSNPYWNPEGSNDLQKHNVNLFDNNEQVVVFGFEDIRRDFSSCDQDFNDALFLVTTNPYSAIDTDDFNQITYDGGGQSSGGGGGLESNRGLSSKVAKRTFSRTKYSAPIASEATIATRSKTELELYVPESFKENDKMIISSPTDLKSITKAEEVWSADYMLNDQAFATVFSTQTSNGIYDHTKVVCERLAGTKVKDVRNTTVEGHDLLLTTLERENGNLEYSISISIEVIDQESYRVFSRWAVDQYPAAGKFLNYQIWSSAPFLTKDIVKQILSNIDLEMENMDDVASQSLKPDVFIESGKYIENTIEYRINNTTQEDQLVSLVGSTTRTEIDNSPVPYLEHITVAPGVNTFQLDNNSGSLFDVELKVGLIGADNYDVVYFSDGAWALDYESTNTEVTNIEILHNEKEANVNEFLIPRNISVDYKSDDYLTVYKNLRPSGSSIDLSAYNGMKLSIEGEGFLEVKLIKSNIENWDEQFYYTIELENGVNEVEIPFAYFRNKLDDKLTVEDMKMITFTQKNLDGSSNNLSLSNLKFTELYDFDISFDHESNYGVYPNPTGGITKITFESDTDTEGTLNIYNNQGVKILTQKENFHKGFNIKQLDVQSFPSGVYWLEISGGKYSTNGQKIIVY